MSDTMVERVARAIDAYSATLPELSDFRAFLRSHRLAAARAAIEAMREPTDAQRNAYYELSHRTQTMFDAHWERAIDAALQETPANG